MKKSIGIAVLVCAALGGCMFFRMPVIGVKLNENAIELPVGSERRLSAIISPSSATNTDVTWSSSDVSVAAVSASGLVTGAGAGIATVTVTTEEGGFTDDCTVTVTSVGPRIVNGHRLSEDETWSGDILLTGDIQIPTGRTLTLLPGTVVKVAKCSEDNPPDWDDGDLSPDQVGIFCDQGRLVMNGTRDRPIVITSDGDAPEWDDWWGIGVNRSTVDMSYCCIAYAYYGMFVFSQTVTAPSIDYCMFYRNFQTLVDYGPDTAYSHLSFLNGYMGYERALTGKSGTLSQCEFSGNWYDVSVSSMSSSGMSVSVSDSNFSGTGQECLFFDVGTYGVTDSSIAVDGCFGAFGAGSDEYGNVATITNPASGAVAGAGCGFDPGL